MRRANFALRRACLKAEHVVSLFAAHVACAVTRVPRLLSCVASRAAFAPPSTAAVEIGLEQSRALRIGCAYLLKQREEILIPQRGQGSSGESPLETPSVHVAAVVVEHHLQSIGAHAGFLACRFSW